jgi:ADP-heptose:LPS heptosyltransferase
MVTATRSCLPHSRVSLLLRSYTKSLAENLQDVASILLCDEGETPKSIWKLGRDIKRYQFDAAVVSSPSFRIAFLLALARIPLRIGTGYRWYSFLFTRRVYEHRKTGDRHEAQYNLSLLEGLGCHPEDIHRVPFHLTDEELEYGSNLLRSLGIGEHEVVVALHPGSGGSARDWKPERFAELAARLSQAGKRVVITGGSGEQNLVRNVLQKSPKSVQSINESLSLRELAAFYNVVGCFVGNSSGPLHLAAAVGTPVVGLYPPIRECSPVRWGPLSEHKQVFVGDARRCTRCQGGRCQSDDCMDQITVEEVLHAVEELLAHARDNKESSIS